jgi:hypothetical protein
VANVDTIREMDAGVVPEMDEQRRAVEMHNPVHGEPTWNEDTEVRAELG